MPTYEYVCSKCGHHFETIQSITEESLTVCRKELCPRQKWGKGKVTRMIVGGAGLLFKGSGFYSTDYRSDNYKAGAKKEAPPAASTSTSASASASGDSKPAVETKATKAKTESKTEAKSKTSG